MSYNFDLSQIFVSLAIIATLWFGLFGSLRRDSFRCRVRKLRDDLFDFMWQNGHSFETPAYQEVRQSLNGMLRISNRLGPVAFLLGLVIWWNEDDSGMGKVEKLRPGPLKTKIEEIQERAVKELIAF